jgi:hypothetical protein
VTVDVLEEVLPLHANHTSVEWHLQQVAERLEGELGDEQPFFIEGCQRDWDALPRPDGPLTVSIDGGYVHGLIPRVETGVLSDVHGPEMQRAHDRTATPSCSRHDRSFRLPLLA